MKGLRLSRAPLSMRLLVTTLLCMAGLIYISLLIHIWQDTEMKASLIAKAYGSMESLELADHTHKYLPFYTIYLFLIPTTLLMFTSFSERVKSIFAILPFILIVIDIASMWLIPYVHKGFSWVLMFAGSFLAFAFLILFVLNIYDIWLRKA